MSLLERLGKILENDSAPLAVFAGAGVSISSGLPDYERFSCKLIEQFTTIADKKTQLELAKRVQPEILLQVMFEQHGKEVLEIFDWFKLGHPSENHRLIASLLHVGCSVFTTNIDCLIEKACSELSIEIEVVATEEEYKNLWATSANPSLVGRLFKLHGSIGEHSEVSISDYDKIQFSRHQVGKGLTEFKARTFEQALMQLDFMFLGYSAMDRFSIQPLIRRTKASKSIFWLRHATNSPWVESTHWDEMFKAHDLQIRSAAEKKISYNELDWEMISIAQIAQEHNNFRRMVRIDTDVDELPRLIGISSTDSSGPLIEIFPPDCSLELTDFSKEVAAAKILSKASMDERAKQHIRKLESSENSFERGIANQIAGSLNFQKDEIKERLESAIEEFGKSGDILRALECRIDLANVLRQLGRTKEAFETLHKAEATAEGIDESELALRACFLTRINYIRGLTGLREHNGLELLGAIENCEEAISFAGVSQNRDQLAEAMNAKALVIEKLIKNREVLLKSAVKDLTDALEISISIGDLDGCYKQYRNLGLIYKELADFAKSSNETDDFFKLREQAGSNYTMAGHILDLQPADSDAVVDNLTLLSAQAYAGVPNRNNDARKKAIPLKEKHSLKGDWHSQARTLRILIEVENEDQEEIAMFRYILELHSIYSAVLNVDLDSFVDARSAAIEQETRQINLSNLDLKQTFWKVDFKVKNAIEFLEYVERIAFNKILEFKENERDQDYGEQYTQGKEKWQTVFKNNEALLAEIKLKGSN